MSEEGRVPPPSGLSDGGAEKVLDIDTGLFVSKDEASTKVTLSWNNINYYVNARKEERKHILSGVSGSVTGGELMCILGPSGSGKTSLINILGKKLRTAGPHEVTGSVLCNDVELSGTQFQRISGIVSQEDVFNSVLTVRETLRFAAKLKLPAAQRQERIQRVTSLLQLEGCLGTYIGDDSNPYLKGISGGEKRRLAIGVEILDPGISVLILDEPTSGLDAAAALNVANLMKSLAQKGITVCSTLHQPRSAIMKLFDQLMVLAAGKRVYYGGVKDYVPYLEGPLKCEVPRHESPYDLLLDALNPAIAKAMDIPMQVIPAGCEDVPGLLAELFLQSALRNEVDKDPKLPAGGIAEVPKELSALVQARKQPVGACGKFVTILHRTFLIKCRDPIVAATLIFTAIMMGVMFGILYFQSYKDKTTHFAILDTQMAITMVVTMIVFLPYDVTLTFPKERQIFLRERKAGLYSTEVFFFARITADMPMHLIAAGIMSFIVYFMAGLKCGVGLFMCLSIFGILVGASLMQMIGALSRSFEEANLLMMLILMLSMVMSSAFVREVPSWLVWMREVSVMGLLADMAVYMEFKDSTAETYGEAQALFENYAIRLRDDDDVASAAWTLFAIWLISRILCWFAVKFMHTGRSFKENLLD
jgi:ABC-type multidrug transport system ATPase subunit